MMLLVVSEEDREEQRVSATVDMLKVYRLLALQVIGSRDGGGEEREEWRGCDYEESYEKVPVTIYMLKRKCSILFFTYPISLITSHLSSSASRRRHT